MARVIDFWNRAANGIYDRFVLGKDAPYEIQHLLTKEDQRLINTIEGYVRNGQDVLFVEIGSGTGRYLSLFGEKMLLDKLYDEHLKYIVGVDFSKAMIMACLDNLVGTRKLGNKNKLSLAHEVSSKTKIPLQVVQNKFRDRILLINADATKPFLQISGINIVVGIMFGTLGNIPQQDELLRNATSIFKDDGKIIVTVFNREAKEVGLRGYTELAAKGFEALSPLKWDREASAFTSGAGFYSRWFSYTEFKELLERYFQRDVEIVPIASQGLSGIAKIEGNREECKVLSEKQQTEPAINLVCPTCGETVASLPCKLKNIACPSCGAHYGIQRIHSFYVPSLILQRSTPGEANCEPLLS